MNKRIFLIISCFVLLSIPFFLWQQNVSEAQTKKDDDSLYMIGSIENNKTMTGFYSKNAQSVQNKNWCVFIGNNGKVYKIQLIDKSIHTLHIDGQKIADSQIWKHTAEYKPYLEKMWRITEIENKSAEIDSQIKPIDRKIAALDKEMQKLDEKEEQMEKNSTNFAENQKSFNAERKKLSEMIKKHSEQIEELSEQQEILSKEMESLDLMKEIDKVLSQISADLKALGVIKSSSNVSFKLSNSELIVNGKKASPEVYDLLKSRYIVEMNGSFGFLYHWKGEV